MQKCLEEKGLGDVFPAIREIIANYSVTPRGSEQPVEFIGNLARARNGGTKGGPRRRDFEAGGSQSGKAACIGDARLQLIVDRWDGLPDATRAEIVALVQESAPTVDEP